MFILRNQNPSYGRYILQFAVNYTTRSGLELTEDVTSDALPTAEDERHDNICVSIKLQVALATCINSREAIIRFHRFNQEKEPSKVYRSKIILYVPWNDESSELLGEQRLPHS